MRLFVVDDRCGRRLRRRCRRRARPVDAVSEARRQIGVAGANGRDPRRNLSRPRCRPARHERPHRPGRRRADRCGAVDERPARLHPDQRHRGARADHPAAQRLCRNRRLGGAWRGRRRAETDRRRHARDLRRRGPRASRPGGARRGGAGAPGGRRAEPQPRRSRSADDPGLSGLACRRRLLRQCRQQGPPRFHRDRPVGQRGQPHPGDEPFGRAGRSVSAAFAAALGAEVRGRLVSVGRYAVARRGATAGAFHPRARFDASLSSKSLG